MLILKGRGDSASNEWAIFKENKYLKIGPLNLTWQPCLKEIRSADLVVVEQADRLLINYILMIKRLFGSKKIAFWGHGQNMQANRDSLANKFKRVYINWCDWWFAYTNKIEAFLVKNGYPADQITVVQNAINTKQMYNEYINIPQQEVETLRKNMGYRRIKMTLIYCGALYKEKRLSFLIDVVDDLIKKGFDVKLLIIGGGPDEYIIKEAALTRPYLLLTGPKFGREKAKFFRLADVFLLPGAMGLAILDSFAFATPIVTTEYEFHGPEIEYLVNDVNGIITDDDFDIYTAAIIDLLNNPGKLKLMSENCVKEIEKYSNEAMVDNFIDGVKKMKAKVRS